MYHDCGYAFRQAKHAGTASPALVDAEAVEIGIYKWGARWCFPDRLVQIRSRNRTNDVDRLVGVVRRPAVGIAKDRVVNVQIVHTGSTDRAKHLLGKEQDALVEHGHQHPGKLGIEVHQHRRWW